VRLSYLQLLINLPLMAGFTTFIAATPLGRAQRACEQDIRMAAVPPGVDVDRVISTTFMMGAALMLSATGTELLANPDVRAAYLEGGQP
jgi:branched-chain amino acid transport system permease protein